MDQDRPFYSNYVHGNSSGSSSPGMSPASTFKRPPNVQAASQLLAATMMKRAADSNEDEDHDDFEFGSPSTSSCSFPHDSHSNVPNALGGSHLTPATTPEQSPSAVPGRNSIRYLQTINSKSAERPFPSMPSTASASPIKTPVPIPPIQLPKRKPRADRRTPLDAQQPNLNDTGNKHEVSALRDELDMLQGENYSLWEKLQQSEDRCSKAEVRARELEKQVAKLGQGRSLDDEFARRREGFLREREIALKNGRDKEIVALRLKMENLMEDREAAITQLQEANSELNALHTTVHRMVLTQDEKEEVVLKRCWLARYWGLAAKHGICTDVAHSRHEYWSSLALLPFEVVISAGVKAKEESWGAAGGNIPDRRELVKDTSDLTGEGYIESMLLVEAGLKELSTLKVEEAVSLAMAQSQSNLARQSTNFIFPGDFRFIDTLELSKEEAEDILFKQAWLTYFWRRAVVHHIEEDIARERLQSWIGRSGQTPSPHDAVEAVERGSRELQKLGIERQLWEASRKLTDHPPPPTSASSVIALLDGHDQ
ncbi:coiled-coil domain-containing protein SCD2 isoform X4 [Eucalyptus grandis]|uniref:coiled-coil domain-containing protein SCD2 isoform X4 n=1 Tax=Eucalyptus grandis TaxID=71139 RepID=UPI00192E7B38|nr:coiled-coil domain-containing protein SCD2 isoform X4 [Eucalyptus grandis]